MLEMCLEGCYYPLPLDRHGNPTLPEGFTVEHLDHHRQHNCYQNLMLLDKRIHDALSWAHANFRRKAYRSIVVCQDEEVPDWVTAGNPEEESADA